MSHSLHVRLFCYRLVVAGLVVSVVGLGAALAQQAAPQAPPPCETQLARAIRLLDTARALRDTFEARAVELSVQLEQAQQAAAAAAAPKAATPPAGSAPKAEPAR
jgi:hypothetical protein